MKSFRPQRSFCGHSHAGAFVCTADDAKEADFVLAMSYREYESAAR
jgi:hypothetical protein